MRWIQKIVEAGEPPQFTSYLVRDRELGDLPPEDRYGSVRPVEAARLVATGEWRYVDAPGRD